MMADVKRCCAADMLAEFHDALGQPFGHGEIEDSALRMRLHDEENRELVEALKAGDIIGTARELADVVYVAYGTAHSLGIPLDEVLAEVHRANMSKFGPDGEPILDGGGKLLKGPLFREPDVAGVLSGPCAAESCVCGTGFTCLALVHEGSVA